MLRLLFAVLLAGLWQSLEVAQCRNPPQIGYINVSLCYNTSSGKTCFTTFPTSNDRPVRLPFNEASDWCKVHAPGSSLIVINSLEIQRTVEVFIGREVLSNETIVIDARKLSASESLKWSWVNGHPTMPNDVTHNTTGIHDGACVESKPGQPVTFCFDGVWSLFRFICEYSESISDQSDQSYRQNNKSYVSSRRVATWYDARNECLRLRGDLASITDLRSIQDWSSLRENRSQRYWIGLHRNKWIWDSTGAAVTYTDWYGGFPAESPDKQCICIYPRCRSELYSRTICENDRKWWACNCNNSYATVCQKEEETASSAVKSSLSIAALIRTTSSSSAIPIATTSTSVFESPPAAEPNNSSNTKQILLILLLLVVVVLIVFIAIVVIRKYRTARGNYGWPWKKTDKNESVSPEYETMVRDKRPQGDTIPIYTELELIQRPTPSSSTIYANAQPTTEAVDKGIHDVYVNARNV